MLHGWPSQEPKGGLQQYWRRKEELSVLDGWILWSARVIVPPPGRDREIQELHETHPGIARKKSLARSYVWWPNMDADLEAKVRTCTECQSSRPPPPPPPPPNHQQHRYTHGSGLRSHGHSCILIMQDCS